MTATQAPTPGPLSAEDVKLLVKGDLLLGTTRGFTLGDIYVFQSELEWASEKGAIHYDGAPYGGGTAHISHFAFIGRPVDADGWIEHDGSDRNPLPGATVDARGSKFVLEPTARPSEEIKWDRVRMWRPSRLAPTAPVEARGSEREEVEDIEWPESPLANDLYRHIQSQFCLHDDEAAKEAGEVLSILAKHGVDPNKLPHDLRPQPNGETRESDDKLFHDSYIAMRDAMRLIDADEGPGRVHSNALQALADCRVRIENRTTALLSARALALGGQHSGGEWRCEDCGAQADEWFDCCKNPARAEAQDEGAAGEWPEKWSGPCAVGNMIANLRTLPPEMPIYTAYHIPMDGEPSLLRVKRPTVSRERVDGITIKTGDESIPYSAVIWTQPQDPNEAHPSPPPAADEDRVREEVARVEALIEDLTYAAMPTKPDVVTLCGSTASQARDDLRAILSALKSEGE